MFYTKEIRIPLYDMFVLQVVVGDEIERINEFVDIKDNKEWFADTITTSPKCEVCEDDSIARGIAVVLNPSFTGCAQLNVGIISHEAVHVKNIIFRSIKHKNSTKIGEDEPEAYLINWIVNTINNFYEECLLKENNDGDNSKTTST